MAKVSKSLRHSRDHCATAVEYDLPQVQSAGANQIVKYPVRQWRVGTHPRTITQETPTSSNEATIQTE